MKLRSFGYLTCGLLAALTTSAQTTVSFTGGQLAIRTGSGDQQVKVEVAATSARLFGFAGIADGRQFDGVSGISLQTGSGYDQIELAVETAASLSVSINSGTGNSNTLVKWKVLGGSASPLADLDIVSGTGTQRFVNVEMESEARNATIAVDAGAADEIVTKVISSNDSDALRVSFSGAAPKLDLEVGSSASILGVDIRGAGTAGADVLKYSINQTRPAAVDVTWNVDAGGGDDLVEAKVSASGSTVTQRGTALGQAGADQLLFETDAFATITGLTLNGGIGNDTLQQVIKGRFQSSQTLQTVLAGGDGDDILVLTTDTGIFGTGLPNDTFPVINCGPGFDRYQAFGLIRFCEARL